MKRYELMVCDPDIVYARRLTQFLEQMERLPFSVQAFTDSQKLEDVLREEDPRDGRIWLVNSQMMKEIQLPERCPVIALTESKEEAESFAHSVYKYQAVPDLAEALMQVCMEAEISGKGRPREEAMLPVGEDWPGRSLIGVYSPVGRCGKTRFALGLGQQLAQRERVLYLNLEDYHGFDDLFGTENTSNIIDLIYFLRRSEGALVFQLGSMVKRLGELDYIPPALSSWDLREVSLGEWQEVLGKLAVEGEYETVILDIGTQPADSLELLGLCGRVYVPTLEDAWSVAKIKQFWYLLEEMGYRKLKEKLRFVRVPEWTARELAEGPEGMLRGRLGAYIRHVLEQE